jgi:ribosomal protein S12 methylthiotransferase
MHRPGTKAEICRLIEKLRMKLPDIVLRTTFIVGFPGESDQQFNELLDFVKRTKFDALGAFKYYPESGTAAAEMAGQVPNNIKEQRIEELMLTQQEIAFAKNKNRIGSELTCLVDSVETKNPARGRFYGQAPDIDGVCIIKRCSAKAGKFINVKVTDTNDYDLVVEQI